VAHFATIIRAMITSWGRTVALGTLCAALLACENSTPEPTKEKPAVPIGAANKAGSSATAKGSASAAESASPPAEPLKQGEIAPPADVAKPPADAVKEKSGLTTKVLTPGKGKDKPRPNDTVKVHYTGWTKDGKMFDSSVARGEPAEFKVDEVIKGWTEGLQLMVTGEKRRFWIPADLAYGEKPQFGPGGDLTFDVELIDIQKGAEPPPVPTDLTKPPADAKKTKSGLIYRVLTKGKGTTHPKETSTVTVHYSGWTKDGKMFDSSVTRGKPTSFPLNRVIKGWTEGVQLMVEGEKTRFWIPADLAYGAKPTRPGAPAGDLVFDVELLKID
jgi:FKBP-type peptidyl-prolyl cis-trans isomerase